MRQFIRAAAALALSLIALGPLAAAADVAAPDTLPPNCAGIWSTESDRGINCAYRSNVVFAAGFTFAADGTLGGNTVVLNFTPQRL